MKQNFTFLIKVFTLVSVLMISASAFAQFTVRGYPTSYTTFNGAVGFIVGDATISDATIDVAAGTMIPGSYGAGIGVGRPLTITVQGAGAATTLLRGYSYTMAFGKNSTGGVGTAGTKWLGLDKSAPADNNLVMIFKDITFYNWGYNYQPNALVSSYKTTNTLKISFYNCNFYKLWATSGNVLALPAAVGNEGYFENCSFYDNTVFNYTGKTMDGMIKMSMGKLTVKNSTFYSNFVDPRTYSGAETPDADVDSKTGSIIGLSSSGDLDVTLENNAFINNAPQGGENFIHPAIAFKRSKTAPNSITTITMKNNIFIGNRRAGKANDADIYFEDSTTVVLNSSSTGNIANKVIKRVWNATTNVYDYVPVTNLQGFKISEAYTYTHPDIMFTMDGVLPLVTVDTKGINHVQYSGNGGTVSAKNESIIPEVKVFPNPSSGLIAISLPTYLINSVYEVYSISGVKVKAGIIAGNLGSIDLSNAPKGIYMLKVIKGSEISVQRFVLK